MAQLKIKHYLLLTNLLAVFFLIIFTNLNFLPLAGGDFLFLAMLVLIFALYRPGWAFVLLVGTIALENINLLPASWPLILRPYQFLTIAVGISLLARLIFKKLNFSLPKWSWWDLLTILIVAASFFSSFFAQDKILSLKLSLILASFVFIYFLTRIYLQEINDVKRILPFFLTSSGLIIFYGIWQNWRFSNNLNNFEVMPGRPNATFAEADWLGIFLVLIVSLLLSLIYYQTKKSFFKEENLAPGQSENILKVFKNIHFLIYFVLTSASFILLILTVSRSAWLGTMMSLAAFIFLVFTNLSFNRKKWDIKRLIFFSSLIVISFLFSLGIIYVFNLTTFQLAQRLESSGSGKQLITVSCLEDTHLPSRIEVITDLEKYTCRHINLEEIQSEKAKGLFIKEVDQPDPNFNIRSKIYNQSWQAIKNHWLLGIGWGNIGKVLGSDERGATLNASNLFLEIYLGSGLIGFLSFFILWLYIFLKNVWKFFFAHDIAHKTLALFIVVTIAGLTVTNLFNSGIMLGFMWIFLAISLIKK